MIAAALGFSMMNAMVRVVAADLNALEIAFFRNFFALIFLLPWLARAGRAGLRTGRLGTHFFRSVIALGAMSCWYFSIAILPLGLAVALNFTLPLFATIGAALFLGEIVRARRWSATLIGFAGVLIILGPGFAEGGGGTTLAMLLPILAAVFMALSILLVKSLSRSESPVLIVFYMNLFLTPLSLIPALFVWRWPSLPVFGYLVAIGLLAAVAHLALVQAFSRADASAIAPLDYMRLPFIAVIAYFAFGEVPDLWTWVGAAVIAAAAIYIARREAQVARERPTTGAAAESVKAQP